MIMTTNSGGVFGPVMVCDYCGRRIDGSTAAIEVSSHVPDGATAQSFHVHKGDCDRALNAKLGDLDGSDELPTYFDQLIRNTLSDGVRRALAARIAR